MLSDDSAGGLADYAKAISLAIVPGEKATAYLNRSGAYLAMNNQKAALNDLRAAVKAAPDFANAHNALAWALAYTLNNGYNEALIHAQRAVELEENPYNLDTLGLVYYRLKQFAKAVETYTRAITMDPGTVHTYRRRGDANQAWNKGKAALADYQQYLELMPEAEDRQEVEALIAALGGSPVRSTPRATTAAPIATVQPAAEPGPVLRVTPIVTAIPPKPTPAATPGANADEYARRGQALFEQGDLEGARAAFDRAIQLAPGDAELYVYRGEVHQILKDTEAALGDYNRAIQLAPRLASAYTNRCSLRFLALDDDTGALADCTLALSLNPNDYTAYLYRGSIYCNRGQVARANADFVRVNEINPELGATCSADDDSGDRSGSGNVPALEREALIALYNSTDGENWSDAAGWGGRGSPCQWAGVTCGGGHVLTLSLPDNQLSGAIPPELANLTRLQTLDLSENQLTGAIPPALGSLTKLQGLFLYDNQLAGNIPPELGALSSLRVLSLYDNKLKGAIPPASDSPFSWREGGVGG